MKKLLWVAAVMMTAGAQLHAIDFGDFSRYQVILDKKPFGEPPPEPVTPPGGLGPAIPNDDFSKFLKLVAIREDARGLRVGFVDTKAKPPENYYIHVGSPAQNGFAVLEADYEAEKALIAKDGLERWITMDGALIPDEPNQVPSGTRAATTPASASRTPVSSYSERLRQRREALKNRQVQPPKLTGKALDEHLKNYQMELIRSGKPALPIPLTREMDDQLVKEGVLPPAEQ